MMNVKQKIVLITKNPAALRSGSSSFVTKKVKKKEAYSQQKLKDFLWKRIISRTKLKKNLRYKK